MRRSKATYEINVQVGTGTITFRCDCYTRAEAEKVANANYPLANVKGVKFIARVGG